MGRDGHVYLGRMAMFLDDLAVDRLKIQQHSGPAFSLLEKVQSTISDKTPNSEGSC